MVGLITRWLAAGTTWPGLVQHSDLVRWWYAGWHVEQQDLVDDPQPAIAWRVTRKRKYYH